MKIITIIMALIFSNLVISQVNSDITDNGENIDWSTTPVDSAPPPLQVDDDSMIQMDNNTPTENEDNDLDKLEVEKDFDNESW